jgi:cell division protein DivIC
VKFKLPKYLRNKYTLATGVFLLWICFFNDIDLFYIIQSRREVSSLRKEVDRMKEENAQATESLYDLSHNKGSLEKFARENYYMKKSNEDVYVFKERTD